MCKCWPAERKHQRVPGASSKAVHHAMLCMAINLNPALHMHIGCRAVLMLFTALDSMMWHCKYTLLQMPPHCTSSCYCHPVHCKCADVWNSKQSIEASPPTVVKCSFHQGVVQSSHHGGGRGRLLQGRRQLCVCHLQRAAPRVPPHQPPGDATHRAAAGLPRQQLACRSPCCALSTRSLD